MEVLQTPYKPNPNIIQSIKTIRNIYIYLQLVKQIDSN